MSSMSSADFGMTSQAWSAAQKEAAWENFTLLGPFLYALAVSEGAKVYPLGNTQAEIEVFVVVVVDMVIVVGIITPEESKLFVIWEIHEQVSKKIYWHRFALLCS